MKRLRFYHTRPADAERVAVVLRAAGYRMTAEKCGGYAWQPGGRNVHVSLWSRSAHTSFLVGGEWVEQAGCRIGGRWVERTVRVRNGRGWPERLARGILRAERAAFRTEP